MWFEDFGGRDDDAEGAYLAELTSSSIYVGILGRTYGRLLPSRLSATHTEYREAERLGLRIGVWVNSQEDYQGDQLAFVNEVRLFHTTGKYSNAEDLAGSVADRLRIIGAEDLSPWVKLGESAFRAGSIVDDGRVITIDGSVHSPLVVAQLEGQRPGTWAGKRESRVTYSGLSLAVRVKSVETRVIASRATGVRIVLERASDLEKLYMPMSFTVAGKTYTQDEITEIELKKLLFGEAGPRLTFSIGNSISSPLGQLPRERLPAEVNSAVCSLLITEALVSSGRASRVTQLRFGPPTLTGHRVVLGWISRSGKEHQIEGYWLRNSSETSAG